jgi:hypothetical protein
VHGSPAVAVRVPRSPYHVQFQAEGLMRGPLRFGEDVGLRRWAGPGSALIVGVRLRHSRIPSFLPHLRSETRSLSDPERRDRAICLKGPLTVLRLHAEPAGKDPDSQAMTKRRSSGPQQDLIKLL